MTVNVVWKGQNNFEKDLLERHSNEDNVVLASEQTYRSTEQKRESIKSLEHV